MTAPGAPPRAVLFDRDGTLVVDVPYNGVPDAVVPVEGAATALARVRAAAGAAPGSGLWPRTPGNRAGTTGEQRPVRSRLSNSSRRR